MLFVVMVPLAVKGFVNICFRYDLDYSISEFICDKNGRYIIARMEIQGKTYLCFDQLLFTQFRERAS